MVEGVADMCTWCFFPYDDHTGDCKYENKELNLFKDTPLRDAIKFVRYRKGVNSTSTKDAIKYLVGLWEQVTRK